MHVHLSPYHALLFKSAQGLAEDRLQGGPRRGTGRAQVAGSVGA